MMDWKRCGRRRSWHYFRYYSRSCLGGLLKTTKNLGNAIAYFVEALCYKPEVAISNPDEVIGFFN
jgi:hypothetical protein